MAWLERDAWCVVTTRIKYRAYFGPIVAASLDPPSRVTLQVKTATSKT
jgi:hypothetical protein